jgi:hypothetical protein
MEENSNRAYIEQHELPNVEPELSERLDQVAATEHVSVTQEDIAASSSSLDQFSQGTPDAQR